jgi:hypothetical protein
MMPLGYEPLLNDLLELGRWLLDNPARFPLVIIPLCK